MTVWTPGTMALMWRDTSHERHPITEWIGVDVEQGKHPVGALSITAPYGAAWVQDLLNVSAEGVPDHVDPVGHSVELWYRDTSDALFLGPLIKTRRLWGPGYPEGAITFTFEHIFGHQWRRRISQSPTNAGYAASTPTQNADVLAQRIMNDGLGKTYANGGMFALAPPYDVGYTTARDDTEAFTPWTVAVATLHSPALSATSVAYDQQDGRNLLDTLIWLGDTYDIAYTWDESSVGTITYNTTGTYQRTDLSASVVLGEHRGNVLGFDHEYDYTAVSNTWYLKGDGETTAQIKNWYQDTNSDTIGIYENTATAPYMSSTKKLNDIIKPGLFGLYSEANQAITVDFVEQPGAYFNSTFGVRDLVKFASPTFGLEQSVLVVGYKMSINAAGDIKISLTLSAAPHRLATLQREWGGGPGGRGGGGLFWRRDG